MKPESYILCHDCDNGTEALRGLVDFCNGHGITDVRAFGGTDMKMIILTGPVSSH